MTPDRAAAERVAREIRLSACTCNAPGFADLCPHNAITTALLTWGAQRWREGVEDAADMMRYIWPTVPDDNPCQVRDVRADAPRFIRAALLHDHTPENYARALLPPPGEGTPGE